MRVVALPIVCHTSSSRGVAAALLLCALACSRTGLDPSEPNDSELMAGESGGGPASVGGNAASGDAPITHGGSAPTVTPPHCQPAPETCNGRDDDCNGAVDELPAVACPEGGFRFCVAGRLSECPKRCEVCVPGSVRICQNSFCSFWGEQECAADGLGFSNCREAHPPPECAATAKKFQDSPELEQCCIDNGYCCLDQFDLDRDGDRGEVLGACGDIVCR